HGGVGGGEQEAAAGAPPPPAAPAATTRLRHRRVRRGQQQQGCQAADKEGAQEGLIHRRTRPKNAKEASPEQGGGEEEQAEEEGLHPAARVQQDQAGSDRARTPQRKSSGSALPRQQPPRRARHRRKRSRRHRWPQLRGGDVRRGVRAVAGGAQPAHVRAAGGAAAAPAGGGAADVRGELPGAPRRGAGHQGRRHQGRRLPPHLRRLEEPRRALLPLARRLPPLRGHQDGAFARGPADGAADRGGVRAAAIGGADGGGAEPGPGHPLPGALRHRRLRRAHLLLHPQRLQLHGPDGPRRPQAHHPRRLRQTEAEKLRQQMLHRLHQVLTARQMARSLLAVSDYFHRLRVLSSFWVNRNRMAPQDQQLEAGPHT
uniref:DOG1 domain-containing protein n=1 Tax=Aegilops tauschii subsp. strangulata TaxID=200361 RepID=A0A453L425_AEGTS